MQTINVEQLKEMKQSQQNLTVINVLPESSHEKAHVPGSITIPLETDDFVQPVERAVGGKARPLVVYCANPSCDLSPKAAKQLESSGFTEVFDFEGGVEAWREEGELVTTGT